MHLFNPIITKESPKQVLEADFDIIVGKLPISGGWGYSKLEACIINKNDSINDLSLPFSGIDIEQIFIEHRTYEEMIIFRPEGEKFSGFNWNILNQSVLQDNNRYYKKLVIEITAFADSDWEDLKNEYNGPNGYGSSSFQIEIHMMKRQEKMMHFKREFWFDITSYYIEHSVNKNTRPIEPIDENIYCGIRFPSLLNSFELRTVIDEEKSDPGLGVTLNYIAPHSKVSIFIYNLSLQNISENIESPVILDEYENAIGDIYQLYPDARIIVKREQLLVSGLPILHSEFQYTKVNSGHNIIVNSHLYLTAINDNFIKIRVTNIDCDNLHELFIVDLCRILFDSRKIHYH